MSEHISSFRLSSYGTVLKLTCSKEVLRSYYWSIALSAAFSPILQCFEVTFRNQLNNTMYVSHAPRFSGSFKSYQQDVFWFETILKDVQSSKIHKMRPSQKAKWIDGQGKRLKYSYGESAINKVKERLLKEGRQLDAPATVSRLDFGFWLDFLSQDYEDVTNQHLIWPNMKVLIFPNAPLRMERSDFYEKIDRVREIRNRLSHHEPIWKFFHRRSDGKLDYQKPVYGVQASISLLNKQYDEILELIGWLSLDAKKEFLAAGLDRNFKNLCSLDGFYAYVDSGKISKKIGKSKAKREIFSLIQNKQHKIVCVGLKSKDRYVYGLITPNF